MSVNKVSADHVHVGGVTAFSFILKRVLLNMAKSFYICIEL